MTKLVLDVNDRRPVWALPGWAVEEIRCALPDDWDFVSVTAESEGTGDGSTRISQEVLTALAGARVYIGFGIAPEILTEGEKLEWVHTASAGVGKSLSPEMLESPVLFTNSAGIHGPPMAETVLAMMLHFGRGLDFAEQGKATRTWHNEPFYDVTAPVRELAHSTVGILGLGGVGREVAWRVRALGARVIGLKRRPSDAAGGEGASSVDGVEVVYGAEGLARLASESDYLIVTAPHTDDTRGIVSREVLALMKSDAVLINVSRGALVDEAALVEALQAGRLRGAGLDVFSVEPLPEDHALWDLPNVLITPHVSPVTREFWRREVDLIVENLERFLSGRPLRNLVDKQAGY